VTVSVNGAGHIDEQTKAFIAAAIESGQPMPPVVQVGPYRFTVRCDTPSIAVKSQESGNKKPMGLTDTLNLTIDIDPKCAPDQRADTLLHEVLHTIICTVGGWEKGWTEEDAISALSPTLLDTLRRNPDLVRYLLGEYA
jgi:hypothetical protein